MEVSSCLKKSRNTTSSSNKIWTSWYLLWFLLRFFMFWPLVLWNQFKGVSMLLKESFWEILVLKRFAHDEKSHLLRCRTKRKKEKSHVLKAFILCKKVTRSAARKTNNETNSAVIRLNARNQSSECRQLGEFQPTFMPIKKLDHFLTPGYLTQLPL